MPFSETELRAPWLILPAGIRGHGLKPIIAQANIAFNAKAGTLRGMHFQYPPAAETKLVRCCVALSSILSSTCGPRAPLILSTHR